MVGVALPPPPPPPPKYTNETITYHAGQTFYTQDGVDYVFAEVPEEVSISGSATSVTHHWIGVDWRDMYPDSPESPWGWEQAWADLLSQGNMDGAAGLVSTVLLFDPTNETAQSYSAISNGAVNAPVGNGGGGLGVVGGGGGGGK